MDVCASEGPPRAFLRGIDVLEETVQVLPEVSVREDERLPLLAVREQVPDVAESGTTEPYDASVPEEDGFVHRRFFLFRTERTTSSRTHPVTALTTLVANMAPQGDAAAATGTTIGSPKPTTGLPVREITRAPREWRRSRPRGSPP